MNTGTTVVLDETAVANNQNVDTTMSPIDSSIVDTSPTIPTVYAKNEKLVEKEGVWKKFWRGLGKGFLAVLDNLLHWTWTKSLLYWLIFSAGVASELTFLVASLWMSLNASVHTWMLMVLTEKQTVFISGCASAAYVALPECILFLSIITTINRANTWVYNKEHGIKDWWAVAWTFLYGIPMIVFASLSIYTLCNSFGAIDFQLPVWMIGIRAVTAFLYAVVAYVYADKGREQEKRRLQKKDSEIANLIQAYQEVIATKDEEIVKMKADHAITKQQLRENKIARLQLESVAIKSDEAVLKSYPDAFSAWLKDGNKTIKLPDITRLTGHHSNRISAAIRNGDLKLHSRGQNLVITSSLLTWLKTAPMPKEKDKYEDDDENAFNQLRLV